MKILTLFVLFSTAFINGYSQVDSLEILLKKTQSSTPFIEEIVHLQFNKSLYQPGDTVFIKGYVVNRLRKKLLSGSHTLWVFLLSEDDEKIDAQKFLIIDGLSMGQIVLPNRLEDGIYKVVAFTNWQKNSIRRFPFSSTIEVKTLSNKDVNWSVSLSQKKFLPGDSVNCKVLLLDRRKEVMVKQDVWLSIDKPFDIKKRERTLEDGSVVFPFKIPTDAVSHFYNMQLSIRIRNTSTGQYDETIHKETLPIINRDLDVQFMPESGHLVAGITSKVAFKVLNSSGYPEELEGLVVDSKGDYVSALRTMHDGMGFFMLSPKQGEHYRLQPSSPEWFTKTIDLPKVEDRGIVLSVEGIKDHKAQVSLKHNLTDSIVSGSLAVNMNGFCYLYLPGSFHNLENFNIPLQQLPAGIVYVTFFNDKNEPLAERLLFVNGEKELNVQLDLNYSYYLKRQKSALKIKVTDPTGLPVKANLSMAVIDSVYGISRIAKAVDIKTNVLLQSEMKGHIHNPAFYFEGTRKEPYLDLLVMTHGWRSYEWVKELNRADELTKGLRNYDVVSGRIERFGKPLESAKVSMYAFNSKEPAAIETKENGKFWFVPEYMDRDVPGVFVQATSKTDKKNVTLILDSMDIRRNNEVMSRDKINLRWENIRLSQQLAQDLAENNQPFLLGDVKLLKSFDVVAKPKDEFKGGMRDLFSTSGGRYKTYNDLDDMGSLSDLIQQVMPSLNYDPVTGEMRFPTGDTGVLFVIDGFPRGTSADEFFYLTLNQIKDIMVVKGFDAFPFYGPSANGGAVIIRTRIDMSGSNVKDMFDRRNVSMIQPFCKEARFYTPKYDTDSLRNDPIPDLRTTIHWDNNIVTDANGEATLEFYNGDLRGTKMIIIQGVGVNGMLASKKISYILK